MRQPSVSGNGCLFFFLQAMQSLRKAISSSSRCHLPAKVKETFDGAERCRAIDCPNSLRFQRHFRELFFPLLPLPIQAYIKHYFSAVKHIDLCAVFPSLLDSFWWQRAGRESSSPPATSETVRGLCCTAMRSSSATSRHAARPLRGSAGEILGFHHFLLSE